MKIYIFNSDIDLSLLFAQEIGMTISDGCKFGYIYDSTTKSVFNRSILDTYEHIMDNGMNQLRNIEYHGEAKHKIEKIRENINHHIHMYGHNPNIKIIYNYSIEDVYQSIFKIRDNKKFNLENLNIEIL